MELCSEITARVWKVVVSVGHTVEQRDAVVILESMKMEIPVLAGSAGRVRAINGSEGAAVEEGQVVAVIE